MSSGEIPCSAVPDLIRDLESSARFRKARRGPGAQARGAATSGNRWDRPETVSCEPRQGQIRARARPIDTRPRQNQAGASPRQGQLIRARGRTKADTTSTDTSPGLGNPCEPGQSEPRRHRGNDPTPDAPRSGAVSTGTAWAPPVEAPAAPRRPAPAPIPPGPRGRLRVKPRRPAGAPAVRRNRVDAPRPMRAAHREQLPARAFRGSLKTPPAQPGGSFRAPARRSPRPVSPLSTGTIDCQEPENPSPHLRRRISRQSLIPFPGDPIGFQTSPRPGLAPGPRRHFRKPARWTRGPGTQVRDSGTRNFTRAHEPGNRIRTPAALPPSPPSSRRTSASAAPRAGRSGPRREAC